MKAHLPAVTCACERGRARASFFLSRWRHQVTADASLSLKLLLCRTSVRGRRSGCRGGRLSAACFSHFHAGSWGNKSSFNSISTPSSVSCRDETALFNLMQNLFDVNTSGLHSKPALCSTFYQDHSQVPPRSCCSGKISQPGKGFFFPLLATIFGIYFD